MKTPTGQEHGLVKVVGNSVVFNDYKRFKESDREKMKKMHLDECKMVKVTYINTKGADLPLELIYCNWDGDPLLSYKFLPDHEYEIPKGLKDMVNKKKIKKRSGLVDKNNKDLMVDSDVPGEHRFVSVGE